MPEAQPRALREGNTRRFLCEVEPRTQLLIGIEFFQNETFYRVFENIQTILSWFSALMKLFMGPYKKKKPKTNRLFNHLNSSRALWLSWKLCDFGSSGTRFEIYRGQLFISVSPFFLKMRTAKNFKVFHINGDGLRTCAPVKSIKTSQQYSGFHFLCSKLWTVADASSFALKLCQMLEKICRGVPSSPISKRIRKGSSFPRKSA